LLVLAASTGQVWSSTPDVAHLALPSRATGPARSVAVATNGPDLERLAAFRFRIDPPPPKPQPALMAVITRSLPITARPGSGRVIGVMPASSKYLHTQTVAWIAARSPNGRFGKVTVPYRAKAAAGWISLAGLKLRQTSIMVHAYLARHLITVTRLGKVILQFRATTGSPSS